MSKKYNQKSNLMLGLETTIIKNWVLMIIQKNDNKTSKNNNHFPTITTISSYSVPEHLTKSETGTSQNLTFMEDKLNKLEMPEKDISIVI